MTAALILIASGLVVLGQPRWPAGMTDATLLIGCPAILLSVAIGLDTLVAWGHRKWRKSVWRKRSD